MIKREAERLRKELENAEEKQRIATEMKVHEKALQK